MIASDIRSRARESLVGNYWPSVLVALIAAIFGSLIVNSGVNIDIDLESIKELWGDVPRMATLFLTAVGGFAGTLSLLAFILGGVVQLGYAKYLLKQQDKEAFETKDLFSQFDRFGQGFLQALLRNIFVALWSLLFIIPGIIKSYSYAMTPFIMAENPEMNARDAITASKALMHGHKGELFWLDLTFIGWQLLCGLTLGIGSIFLNPYMNAAHAAFYREIAPRKIYTPEEPEFL